MASFMNSSSQGCNTFVTVEKRDNGTKRINERLKQWSANPVVYTRVSCFLPWISEQYNLSYDDDTDDDCDDAGTGDQEPIFNFNPKPCRTVTEVGRECIFPFYFGGRRYDGCFTPEFDGLKLPLFYCPAYNVTTKINDSFTNNINNFDSTDWNENLQFLCLVDPSDPDSELDPGRRPVNRDCDISEARRPFKTCANNCPGGEIYLN